MKETYIRIICLYMKQYTNYTLININLIFAIGPSSLHKLKTTKDKDFLDVLHIGTFYLRTVDSKGRSLCWLVWQYFMKTFHSASWPNVTPTHAFDPMTPWWHPFPFLWPSVTQPYQSQPISIRYISPTFQSCPLHHPFVPTVHCFAPTQAKRHIDLPANNTLLSNVHKSRL